MSAERHLAELQVHERLAALSEAVQAETPFIHEL